MASGLHFHLAHPCARPIRAERPCSFAFLQNCPAVNGAAWPVHFQCLAMPREKVGCRPWVGSRHPVTTVRGEALHRPSGHDLNPCVWRGPFSAPASTALRRPACRSGGVSARSDLELSLRDAVQPSRMHTFVDRKCRQSWRPMKQSALPKIILGRLRCWLLFSLQKCFDILAGSNRGCDHPVGDSRRENVRPLVDSARCAAECTGEIARVSKGFDGFLFVHVANISMLISIMQAC